MRKATPGTSPNPTQPRPPEGSGRKLRSDTARQASSTPSEAQPSKASAPRTRTVPNDVAKVNPSAQGDDLLSTDSETTALFVIAGALDRLINNNQMSEHVMGALRRLSRYASKMGVKEAKQEVVQVSMSDVREIRKVLLTDISGKYEALENKITQLAENQAQILKATDSLAKKTDGIDAAAKGIVDKVTEVNDATVQIASTTKSYKDVLLAQPNQPYGSMVDLKIKDDLDRKAKQILVEVLSDDLTGKSLSEIEKKATEVIAELDDAHDRPEHVEIEAVSTTRTKAILLQLNSKQAANWLRDPFIESKFTAKFAKDSLFIDRLYNIIVPRTPVIFDPKSAIHLRELEECNNLDANSVKKARWIKPANRRREGQTHAYAILSLASPSTANRLIRNGITICGASTQPSKLKHEPMQCLRCRGWGHLIAQCQNLEVCGACGEEHNTSDCDNSHKRYCASCKIDTHASWDRGCPEFIRRCEIHNSRYPENNLPFFPTDEGWTLTTRPDKIPVEDRFPQRYAVNSIPVKAAPRRTQQQTQTRNKPKRQHNQAAAPKGNARNGENNTIIKYFTRPQQNTASGSGSREEGEPPGPSYLDEPANSENYVVEQLIGDAAPRHIPGWS
jgi:hypothetical protein